MIVGTVKEQKIGENRVALTPAGAAMLSGAGHTVLVETDAGRFSGFLDAEYVAAGACIVPAAADVWSQSRLVIKVKEPIQQEFDYLSSETALFTYLHLAAAEPLTRQLVERKVNAIAYETVQLADGSLPLLEPMSIVAGKIAIQVGAHYLERKQGGSGVLLGGVPGVPSGKVAIVGTGAAGLASARVAYGLGAQVTMVGRNHRQLSEIDNRFSGLVQTRYSTALSIATAAQDADVLVCAVATTGAKAAKLVTRAMVAGMRPGSVLVDISIDQGGCAETSHVTTFEDPVYVEEGVIHYCVSNMPAAVPHTSTQALTNATLPYVLELAKEGFEGIIGRDSPLAQGVNTCGGEVTHEAVAAALNLPYTPLETMATHQG